MGVGAGEGPEPGGASPGTWAGRSNAERKRAAQARGSLLGAGPGRAKMARLLAGRAAPAVRVGIPSFSHPYASYSRPPHFFL